MSKTPQCPLAQVERRLEDAANLWHKASEAYFEPDDFRVHLQACIQAFRSVTWILQSHKHAITSFDVWYSRWQGTMRDDPILRWLVKARNKIEKQGDLNAKSILKVTGSGSWFDDASFEKELSPKTRPNDIRLLTLPCRPNRAMTEEALLKVERRWVDSDMPNSEILDALCHCYLALCKVVHDAHDTLASPLIGKCPFLDRMTTTNEQLPKFMLTLQHPRVVWIRLKDGASASIKLNTQNISLKDFSTEEAQRRYGFDKAITHALKTARTFREQCAAWFQYSKRILEVDGYLIPTAFVRTEKGMQVFQLRMDDRADKHMMLRDLADSCKRLDAVAVMLINEAWVAPREFAATGQHAVDCLNRGEAILLHGLKRSGEAVDCINVFSRREGQVCFGEDRITEGDVPNIMTPFVKVWNIQRKSH